MRIGTIHSETILEVILLLVLLVYLSEDTVFARVIAFACILESQGSASLDFNTVCTSSRELCDLIIDELVLGAFEQATLRGLYQLEDRARDPFQKTGVVRKDLEEVGVEHPEEACLLLFGPFAELLQPFVLELELADLQIFLKVDFLHLLVGDNAAQLGVDNVKELFLVLQVKFGVTLDNFIPGLLCGFDKLVIHLVCQVWNDLNVDAVSRVLLVVLLQGYTGQLGTFLHWSSDAEVDERVQAILSAPEDGVLIVVVFNLLVIDEAAGVVERALHFFSGLAVGDALMHGVWCSRVTLRDIIKDFLGESVQVGPLQGLEVLNRAFDGEGEVWQFRFPGFVLVLRDEVPFATLLEEMEQAVDLLSVWQSVGIEVIDGRSTTGEDHH